MATIMDGKALSLKLKEQMKQRIAQLKQQGINPKLVVVLVGDNSASQVYVRNKHKSCGEVGIESEVITMPEQTTQQELLVANTCCALRISFMRTCKASTLSMIICVFSVAIWCILLWYPLSVFLFLLLYY